MPWKPDYVTLAEMKAYERVSETSDDAEISEKITAASRAVDDHCSGAVKRQFGNADAPVARTYRRPAVLDRRTGLYRLEIDDVHTAAALTINGTAYATSGAVLLPDDAALEGKPWTHLGFTTYPYSTLSSSLVIVASWGWATVPAAVKTATKLQAARWLMRRAAPFGIAGSPDSGSETRLLAKVDPDFAVGLRGLRRRPRVG